MQRPRFSGTRERCIQEGEKKLRQKVSRFQKLLSDRFADFFISNLDTEGGKISVSAANFSQVGKVDQLFGDWKDSRQEPILKHIISGLTQLHADNERYFRSSTKSDVSVASKKAFNVLMGRIGWNANKGRLIQGGFLHSIVDSDDPLDMLKAEVLRNIVSGASLADLKKNLAIVARGIGDKPGVLEKHYGQRAFDVFQQYDREVGRILAEKLGLKFAIYQGGLIKTSRPFCIHRNDKVFTTDEIALFGTPKDKYGGYSNKKAGDFQGKPDVYSPFLDLGGYQCRHQLDWISNELGAVLKKQQDGEIGGKAPNEFGHIQMAVDEFDKSIINLKHERGGFYNAAGVLQDITDGSERQISLRHLEKVDTFNGTFTHNHPSWPKDPNKDGNSFSIPDILTSFNLGFKEIRAVTGGATYIMRFDDEFEMKGEVFKKGRISESSLTLLHFRMKRADKKIRDRFETLIADEKLTITEANYTHWHEVWKEFLKDTKGITYVKEKRN